MELNLLNQRFPHLKLITGLNYKNLMMTLLKPKKFKIKNIFKIIKLYVLLKKVIILTFPLIEII